VSSVLAPSTAAIVPTHVEDSEKESFLRASPSYEWISVVRGQGRPAFVSLAGRIRLLYGWLVPVQDVDFKTVAFVRSATLPGEWYSPA
jgi:hypothetical protein